MNDSEKIFRLVMLTGEILLKNGAEIFRVQETMLIIAQYYKVQEIDIFTISNGIFVTMSVDGKTITSKSKHIPIAPVHLGRIAAVNNLSREIVAGKYEVDEAIAELHKISVMPYSPNSLRIIFAGLGSGSFCYLLGGSAFDSLAALIAGMFLYIFILCLAKTKTPKVLMNVFGSAVVTVISILLYSLGIGDELDHIMIGAIICLVPGVAITTSIRDFFNEDYLAGTIHLVDAILVAASIAVGVGVIFKVWRLLGGI
ncbi:MAG TPA: threonine/serine exporter family protein [Clostridiales bacterium]|nr:threonine/serine exporter family protein [Clostridiales bacterium]